MRAEARLRRLERATRRLKPPDPMDALSDDELARAIELTRRMVAEGRDFPAAAGDELFPLLVKGGLIDEEGRCLIPG
jgi:hypothetical protein